MIKFVRPTQRSIRHLSSTIERRSTTDPRMSGSVTHGNLVYLSGQVPTDFKAPLNDQVISTLEKVDVLLHKAGSDKSNLLSAQIWLKDIDRDFSEMNEIYSDWLDPANKPVRACVQAPMANPDILFEIMVVAAKAD
ncbi:hypothetical protein TrRE_jg6253 [Triparma retinervis]|uniref:Uncharacterized protein n=1 Tax=Triparma retinervis TaxID=2557542 RepID=A0A9W7L4K3_9STRA|nr:hypothetical protein TrRE_jg6253 [Triparma retinervis]